jgi:ABC-type enterobactin transport system permease subunit
MAAPTAFAVVPTVDAPQPVFTTVCPAAQAGHMGSWNSGSGGCTWAWVLLGLLAVILIIVGVIYFTRRSDMKHGVLGRQPMVEAPAVIY